MCLPGERVRVRGLRAVAMALALTRRRLGARHNEAGILHQEWAATSCRINEILGGLVQSLHFH
jgi:hypothetical protein